MENKNQMTAIKSLSSLLISLLAVIGIIFTLLTYFIVSPSIASLENSSKTIFNSLAAMSDATTSNSRAAAGMLDSYGLALDRLESSIESTSIGLATTRLSLSKLQAQTGYNFANETIKLKNSEDQLNKLKIEVASAKADVERLKNDTMPISESASVALLRASTEFSIAISSLSTLFTGATIIFVLLFLCMILLSAEGLLS